MLRLLAAALEPIAAAAEALSATHDEARLLAVDIFAHDAELLLHPHTGRIRMFGAVPPERMARYIDDRIRLLEGTAHHADH